MKLKKWVKVSLLIIVEILTITFIMNLKTDITFNAKILSISVFIICENLIMFIEGE
jgi:hypothetical protein